MIQPIQHERPNTAKRIVKTAFVASAVTGTALALAKTGKLDRFMGKNAAVDKGINKLKTIADKVWTKAEPIVSKIKKPFQGIIGKVKPLFQKVKGFVTGLFTKVKTSVTRFISERNPADTVVEAMAGKYN